MNSNSKGDLQFRQSSVFPRCQLNAERTTTECAMSCENLLMTNWVKWLIESVTTRSEMPTIRTNNKQGCWLNEALLFKNTLLYVTHLLFPARKQISFWMRNHRGRMVASCVHIACSLSCDQPNIPNVNLLPSQYFYSSEMF